MNDLRIRNTTFVWGTRTYIMGILNITPDSFSDGGSYATVDTALDRVRAIFPFIDILDIGGESTRPGATSISAAEEIDRVIPCIEAIRSHYPELPISLDTMKASVAKAGISAGADMINDVTAGRNDPDMLPLVGKKEVPIVMMHMQGKPQTMQENPFYLDVVTDIYRFFQNAILVAKACSIPQEHILLDPGIGFGKKLEHNIEILRNLCHFQDLHQPLLVGVSRKSFIGTLCSQPDPQKRVWGTAAACTIAIAGGADLLRVHDPQEIREVCCVADGIYRDRINSNLPHCSAK